jgi:N utilization substance protein A
MDPKIRLTSNEMRYIALFENLTGEMANDCIIDDKRDRIILIVKPGNAGRAIGRHGSRIKMMRHMVKKNIEVVESADSPTEFIKNSFAPAKVKEVRITERLDNRKIAVVTIDQRDKGIAIGKNGKTAERTRLLAKRYFGIDNVVIV